MFNLVSDVKGAVGKVDTWVEEQWSQKVFYIAVCGALVFYVLSAEGLINAVDKAVLNMVGVKLGKEGTRLLHALTFGLFMYACVRFILDPLAKRFLGVVEGLKDKHHEEPHGEPSGEPPDGTDEDIGY